MNVADGYHLWSEDYDGDVRDIFTFQSNVAQRVVEALQIKLGGEAARALAKKPTENPEAHRLYLLGRYEFGKYTQAGWNNAIRYYEEALRIDPEFALAYCGLADNYAYMGSAVMPGKEANEKVKNFAQKALQLDPELAEAHMSFALALAGAVASVHSGWVGANAMLALEGQPRKRAAVVPAGLAVGLVLLATLARMVLPK